VLRADEKTHERICAMMQRVLIADPQPASAKLLAEVLRHICRCQIWTAPDAVRALAIAEVTDPHMIFVEHCADIDAAVFTRDVRRSDMACRKAPVIMFAAQATAAAIIGARDAGVHEFLRKPFTIKELMRRLEAVATRPRDWVEGVGYVGPDRRRFNSGDYTGPLKRRVDHAVTPEAARTEQALKILKAAIAAIDTDPRQALRSMQVQADDLRASAQARSDAAFRAAAVAFGQKIAPLAPDTLRRAEIEPLARQLLVFLPNDGAAQPQSAA
jgi:DNA-binding response OmpR family regulator